jgi:dimethylaniline monooxygenase (N-oxide forming)
MTLCQDYLAQVADGSIVCRPGIASVRGHEVTFTDGTRETVEVIVCATGYELDLPYLDEAVWRVAGRDLRLHHHALHPDLPGLGVVGQFIAQGPYLPLLELQARLVIGTWAGDVPPADDSTVRRALAVPPRPLNPHHVFAVELAEAAGVAPELSARPELEEALVFGPHLPPRYRLDGPGAQPGAEAAFRALLDGAPRTPVDPADIETLRRFGIPYGGAGGPTRAFVADGSAGVPE